MYCSHCGKEIDASDAYCPYCGSYEADRFSSANPYEFNSSASPINVSPSSEAPEDETAYIPSFFAGIKKDLFFYSAKGRASRTEFWSLYFFCCLINTVFLIILDKIGEEGVFYTLSSLLSFVFAAWALASFIGCVCAGVRRLHDANFSGWWILLPFFPIFGTLILLVLFLFPSYPSLNDYGAPPMKRPKYR